jgi:hypothetical protein
MASAKGEAGVGVEGAGEEEELRLFVLLWSLVF